MLKGKELIIKSLDIAIEAHKNQYRRDGKTPYIVHPITVANTFNNPVLKSIAYLHDVIEDTNVTKEDLLKQEIPKFIVDMVEVLTNREGEKYLDYILRVKKRPYATMIKIEDIKHNYLTVHKSKQERYDMALYILKGEK